MPRRPSPAPPRPFVLLIGSEALPFSKTGGLADVLGALPLALGRLGWEVAVAVPQYRGTSSGREIDRFPLTVGGYQTEIGIFEAPLADGVRALLVDEPALYDRDGLYSTATGDFPDNPRRFAVLARAALEFMARRATRPRVVHAHDWQAGLVPVYLKTLLADHPVLGGTPVVFTIHNMAYQGTFESDWLPRLDLPWSLLSTDELEFWGRISFLKGGINDAEVVTTVSPQYAREIQTANFGCGFEGVMKGRAEDLVGILNGIDADVWNPATDPHLPQPFSRDDISGKRASKAAVMAAYGLPVTDRTLDRPLVGMISRMVDQKGLDLVEAIAGELPNLGAGFTILGTGDTRYQDFWRGMAAAYPDRIGVKVGFDEGLAHLIEGGADIFLMPSQFEPCGLNQMYSLRYGTVPLVRRVGGLADTVRDGANGFVFDAYSPEALLLTLRRAIRVFKDVPAWRALQAEGMAADHSWDRSAREYVKIYDWAATKGDTNGSGKR